MLDQKSTLTEQINLAMAHERGIMAFEAGIKRVPIFDKTFKEMFFTNCQVGEGIKPMDAWYKGWDSANLRN